MSEVFSPEELQRRADSLGTLNGMELVFVELDPGASPTAAMLTVEFINGNGIAAMLSRFTVDGDPATSLFQIRGGVRRQGGEAPGDVQVVSVAPTAGLAPGLVLRVAPVGDYSTYRLIALDPLVDPVFREIPFRFRPGCFNLNCRKPGTRGSPAESTPPIDYLARDYHSFKHLLITAMMERVPGWRPTSEADLDLVLINLLAARGDELADKQDRVANEAYFGRARRRVSLARHARLVDYHVHQGNQATTWLAIDAAADTTLARTFAVWTGDDPAAPTAQIFEAVGPLAVVALLSSIQLYDWGGLVDALEKGATAADLAVPAGLDATLEADAIQFESLLRDTPRRLLIEESLNPGTGREPGRDRRRRQILRLAEVKRRFDPLAGKWMVRVGWRPEDALQARYCFVTRTSGAPQAGISTFHGNLVEVAHGRPRLAFFAEAGRALPPAMVAARAAFRAASPWGTVAEARYDETRWGRLCALPLGPLAYRQTPPGGEVPPRSTTEVTVEGIAGAWAERIDLIESRAGDNDYIVETSEHGNSVIRFGRSPNGEAPPAGAVVAARYQTGHGIDGNVGADRLSGFDRALFPGISRVWNPLDVTSGRAPESAEVIRRRAPEGFRARQLRAVTTNDYRARAEELPFVQRAAAARAWTGSWPTVRICLDPVGTTGLSAEQIAEAADHLDAVRLIGEDIEIRPPDFVPLDIRLVVCAGARFWPEDLRLELEDAFSEGWTAAGRPGFFHPDRWTFGQPLHASQIIGRALEVTGVDRVLEVGMRHWNRGSGPTTSTVTLLPGEFPAIVGQMADVAAHQIIRVANDPDALENGRLQIEIRGGRR